MGGEVGWAGRWLVRAQYAGLKCGASVCCPSVLRAWSKCVWRHLKLTPHPLSPPLQDFAAGNEPFQIEADLRRWLPWGGAGEQQQEEQRLKDD